MPWSYVPVANFSPLSKVFFLFLYSNLLYYCYFYYYYLLLLLLLYTLDIVSRHLHLCFILQSPLPSLPCYTDTVDYENGYRSTIQPFAINPCYTRAHTRCRYKPFYP